MMDDDFEMLTFDDHYWNRANAERLRGDLGASPEELRHVMARENSQPYFAPLKVRDMIREEHRQERHPGVLLLGRLEMASFRQFVCRGFGEECGSRLRDLYFLGLRVEASDEVTYLELVAG
ncbi:MAG: hypothetical protein ACON4R_12270 [Akkermansiaceae bacterium]